WVAGRRSGLSERASSISSSPSTRYITRVWFGAIGVLVPVHRAEGSGRCRRPAAGGWQPLSPGTPLVSNRCAPVWPTCHPEDHRMRVFALTSVFVASVLVAGCGARQVEISDVPAPAE